MRTLAVPTHLSMMQMHHSWIIDSLSVVSSLNVSISCVIISRISSFDLRFKSAKTTSWRLSGSSRRNDSRRNQVGSGMRGDKIRTMQTQNDRVTNHLNGRRVSFREFSKGRIRSLY